MNIFKTVSVAAAIGLLSTVSMCGRAISQENQPTCAEGQIPAKELTDKVLSAGGEHRVATAIETAALVGNKGQPPVQGPYDVELYFAQGMGVIAIVQDGCIVVKLGPLPEFLIEKYMGNTKVNND